MDDRLPTSLLIAAQIRIAGQHGIPIIVRRRGYEASGTIYLKISRLDGTAHVYVQARMGDEVVWHPVSRADPMPESDAEKAFEKQAQIDPDGWLVEIEDKQGRVWFPGKVIKL